MLSLDVLAAVLVGVLADRGDRRRLLVNRGLAQAAILFHCWPSTARGRLQPGAAS